MNKVLEKIIKEKVNPIFDQYGLKLSFELQRITDIHLYSKIQHEAEAGGDISYIYILGAIATFMLVIACINYINLATARSFKRSKEVGIRKVMGSHRSQLILQFVAESVAITFIAIAISIMTIYTLLPYYNTLANKQFTLSYLLQPTVLFALIAMVIFVGTVGGSYPAFYLSGFNPVNVLKGRLSVNGNAAFRKVLVVFQFGISIFMLASTLVVFNQLEFLRNKDLGFDKEKILKIPLKENAMIQKSSVLAERLKQISHVESVGLSTASPGQRLRKGVFQVEDNEGKLTDRTINFFGADNDFIPTMGMKIVSGRNFSKDFLSDNVSSLLVNEAMVKRFGWNKAIGKKIILKNQDTGIYFERKVIGVVKDYHQNSLYNPIEPLMIEWSKFNNILFVRIENNDAAKDLAAICNAWISVFPRNAFDYAFLDQDFNSQYKADEKRSKIFTIFSALTIVIACLGLLGLTAFTTEQRTKEIGIRKIVGASAKNLVILISKESFLLVGIGMVLSLPAVYCFCDSWLQHFTYRIELVNQWFIILISVIVIFMITAATVGYHVILAAISNPVRALRNE